MKKLNVSFQGITDTTGYLFSLVKCFAATVQHSTYKEYAKDSIAASGFAFRMWADPKQLCPSATSVWDFAKQKEWFENSGLLCNYIQRLWGEDDVAEERRLVAVEAMKASIDKNIAAVAWDVSGCEWGILTGYDDELQVFTTLKIDGREGTLPYEKLGLLEIPILSVLSVCGANQKETAQLLADTKKLAVTHLNGGEWCDSNNTAGLAVYDTIIDFVTNVLSSDTAWNLEYYLGTYAALKWYAWKFFEKYEETELSEIYKTVYESWQNAFEVKRTQDVTEAEGKEQITKFLFIARDAERKAVELMK